MSGKDLLRTLAVTGLLLVTACSAADRPAEDAGGRLRTGLTDAERKTLGGAEERLIAGCMRDKGFEYGLDPDGPRGEVPTRRFGLDDVAWARAHGYGLDEAARSGDRGGKAAAGKSPQARYIASLPPRRQAEFDRALNGTDRDAIVVPAPGRGQIFTSADGCQADARRGLYGDLRKWTEAKAAVVNLEYVTFDDVVAEPSYTKALADWKACMKARGLAYPSSSEAIGAVVEENRSRTAEEARKREVTVAVADAECNRAAGLARTGARLQREHVRDAARNEFARQTRYYTQAVTTALDRARSVAGSD
ncbi:hypothetical protein [Streptomyces sp. NBC_00620]|uniref:hypothetical protein n=1 Tax=Streptomyces sp. NBC_00620 TaxID=2903666 RepID=UPI002258FD05|nr:hypothetical protein [Streptomyces sp. NBC_00620]MCX4972805.1 hypothetical protein [Streptomyces sp. NBC_00620]